MTYEVKGNGARAREIVLINRTDKGPPSRWDHIERVARVLSLVAIPIVLGVGGWWIQNALSERTVNKDYVALAVSILAKSDQEADPGLRLWAVDLLNANSPVKFDPETSRKLSKGELTLPVSPASPFRPITTLPENDRRKTVSRSIGKLSVFVDGGEQWCTAWLISTSHVMTADYCVPDAAVDLTLHLGRSSDERSSGKSIRVERNPSDINRELGYVVLTAEGTPGIEYGYLSLAASSPQLNEQLFITHYPEGAIQAFSNARRVRALRAPDRFTATRFRGRSRVALPRR